MQLNAVRTLTVRGQSQGLDKVKADLDAVSASQQGVAQSSTAMASATETSAKRQLSAANAFERLMERNDRMIYLQRQLEREMSVVNRAHEQGAIDATRHAQAVDLITVKFERLATAEAQARAQVAGTTTALDAQTAAAMRLNAANSNRAGGSFNSANVAAQFQDIGITAAMGQSPLTIALQQGSQLSAVLGGQGLTGVVKTLGAAFASLISPVSLVTIGAVALGAAGIQAFMGMINGAEKAEDALAANKEWLDRVLHGYDEVEKAANEAAVAAGRLPQAAAQAGAGISYTTAQTTFLAQLKAAAAAQVELNDKVSEWNRLRAESARQFPDDAERLARFDQVTQFAQEMNKAQLSVQSTTAEINAFVISAYRLKAAASDDATRQLADDMIATGDALLAARGQAEAAYKAFVDLQRLSPINIAVSVGLDGYESAMEKLKALAPDMRTPRDKARDELVAGLSAADAVPGGGQGLRNLLNEQYQATVAALDLKDAQEEAAKAAREGEQAAKQQAEAYDNLVKSIDDRIAKAEFELSLIGKSADEQARLRIEFELTNMAQGKIPVDQLQQKIDKEVAFEKAARDSNKALADQKRIMDQLAGSAQTVVGSLMGATGLGDTPLGGAANGALGSLMKGDWLGALIGGVTGLFTGFIEQEKKHQEAIKAANDNRPTIEAFIGTGYGKQVSETAAALQRYRQQAEAYIKLAEAAGDKALVTRLKEAAAAYRDTLLAQQRLDKIQDKVDADRDRLREAYERESSALRDVIDQQKNYVAGLRDFKKSLLLDGSLSPLSPQDRFYQAQSQFNQTSAAALKGDEAAQARLQDAATAYLEQARNFYASSTGYVSVFDQVQSVLDRAIASGTSQVSDAERQLRKLDDQVGKLIDINNSVGSVASAIKKLNADMAKLLAAQIEQQADTNKTLKQQAREASQQAAKRAA